MTYRKVPFNEIKKIDIINVPGGIAARDVMSKFKPDYLINLALYDTETMTNIVNMLDENKPSGYLFSQQGIGIIDGKTPIWCDLTKAKSDNTITDFVSGAPALVINKNMDIDWGNKHSAYIDQTHIRSALGFNDAELVLYVSDGALSIKELSKSMLNLGATYAINLDGGGSCHLQEGSKVLKSSGRKNVSWLLVYLDEEVNTMPKIMIDAGHGGDDPGAIGQLGTKEKDIAMQIAKLVGEELTRHSVEVVYTRTGNETLSLSQRTDKERQSKVDYFISLHCNASESKLAHGIETHIISKGGKAETLATKVQSELIRLTSRADRGIKVSNFHVLRETKAPAILIELPFISNLAEEKLLVDEQFKNDLAESIVRGVLSQLNINYKDKNESAPKWQIQALKEICSKNNLDINYWLPKVSENITVGELFGILNKIK